MVLHCRRDALGDCDGAALGQVEGDALGDCDGETKAKTKNEEEGELE